MNETVYEGETLEEALNKAGEALGISPDALEYEVTEKQDGGFWGLDESFVKLRAWPRPEDDDSAEGLTEDAEQETEEIVTEAAEAENRDDPAQPGGSEEATITPTTLGDPPAATTTSADDPEQGKARGFWGASDGADADDSADNMNNESAGETEQTTAPVAAESVIDAATAPVSDIGNASDVEADGTEAIAAKQSPYSEKGAAEQDSVAEPAGDDFPAAAGEAEKQSSKSAADEKNGDASAEIESLSQKILAGMDFDCTVTVQAEDEVYMAMVGGADKELLLEGNGRPLSALELILNHAFRHRLTERRKIRVDAGDFRSRREDELRDLAYQVAHSAKETELTQETQPLNPYERRLVHLALAEDSGVTTRSRGSGFLKNVQVIPRRSGRGNR